jgi:hypothetical protein
MPAAIKPVRIPSYRRHKPSGQAVVTLGGRDVYLGLWRSPESKREYRRLIAEYLAAGGCVRPAAGTPLSVAEVVLAWWRHLEVTYPTNLHTYTRAVRVLRDLYSDVDAADFGPLQLKACRDALVRDGLARVTVNRHVAQIQACFRWGVGEGMVAGGVWHALKAIGGLRRGRTEAPDHEARPTRCGRHGGHHAAPLDTHGGGHGARAAPDRHAPRRGVRDDNAGD